MDLSPALVTGELQISRVLVGSIDEPDEIDHNQFLKKRRWRGHLEAPRGFFSLPRGEKEGVWELFFEVRVIGGGKRCRQLGEVTVARLMTYGEGGGEGDKLLLREGVLGIQVHILKSLKPN